MSNKFRKRSQADADLDSIWGYISADNIKAADNLVNRIGAVFEMLVQNPSAGRERRELIPDSVASPLATTSFSTFRYATVLKSFV
jgi:plasmid stabilization system protein ParE